MFKASPINLKAHFKLLVRILVKYPWSSHEVCSAIHAGHMMFTSRLCKFAPRQIKKNASF